MKVSVLLLLALNGLGHTHELEQRQTNWTVGQTVQTSSGPVNGHAASNATGVSTYLGIPYAQPPTGDLRFAAPVKYSGNSTINGTSFVRLTLSLFVKIQVLT
jgi:cholinesterase